MEKRYPVSHLGGDANQIDMRVSMATNRVPAITAGASGLPKQQGKKLHMPLLKDGIAAVEAQSALPLSVVSTLSEGLLPGLVLIQGNMQARRTAMEQANPIVRYRLPSIEGDRLDLRSYFEFPSEETRCIGGLSGDMLIHYRMCHQLISRSYQRWKDPIIEYAWMVSVNLENFCEFPFEETMSMQRGEIAVREIGLLLLLSHMRDLMKDDVSAFGIQEDSIQVTEGAWLDPGWSFVVVNGRVMQPVGGWAMVDSRLNQPTTKGSHGNILRRGNFEIHKALSKPNGEVEVQALAFGVDPNGGGIHSARAESMVTSENVRNALGMEVGGRRDGRGLVNQVLHARNASSHVGIYQVVTEEGSLYSNSEPCQIRSWI
ncbi:hypothetical protein NE237_000979 [Protea cynaroides]|uniref:Uncharacterized protein n=1 Tax=Protea cynaroides TaxID=273540 RepID=A0A9Q0KS65_9MAGN|nr:hypothetical protein NE237_000979 [Protea cynaroides]